MSDPQTDSVFYVNALDPMSSVPPDSKLHEWSFATHGNVMRLPIGDPYFQRYSAESFRQSVADAALEYRIAEAQQRLDAAKPGECVQIDEELWPYINRTDKNVAMFSDEVTDFPRTEK
jgi:hypothetical protein